MDEKTKEKITDIEALKIVEKNLKEEITKLQNVLSNLDAQKHTAQIKSEQDTALADADKMNKYASEERKLEVKRIEVEKRIDIAETLETKVNDREREVERREQKLSDLEDKIADLNKQRANFAIYKDGIEKELDIAKNTIAEASEIFQKIDMEKEVLKGREIKIKEQEKYWNDEIGKLEQDKKAFQIEKENILGLRKAEVANV